MPGRRPRSKPALRSEPHLSWAETTNIVPGPSTPERLDIAETALGEEKPRPRATEGTPRLRSAENQRGDRDPDGPPKPSDSSATTVNAGPGLMRGEVRDK